MKILVIELDDYGLNFELRCQGAGHEVKVWEARKTQTGDGLITKVPAWKPHMGWADLILVTGNSELGKELEPYYQKQYPIVGANLEGASWELDRAKGQEILEAAGLDILPYEIFDNYDKAIKYVEASDGILVSKPWGGTADKGLSYVPPAGYEKESLLFKLAYWKRKGLKGQFMLQKKISGLEMGVSGWFGPGGWSRWIEEDFEEKKLMNDGLGINTGEQGTTLRFLKRSKLFEDVLRPMEEQLHEIGYVGNVNVNCMIDDAGKPWPMEFTMRLGWPAFNIMYALLQGDPAEWLLGLLEGKDQLDFSPDVAVGLVMSHYRYPWCKMTDEDARGFPLYGISAMNEDNLHYACMMQGEAPMKVGSKVKMTSTLVTAGTYVMVVTGTGTTVSSAAKQCLRTAWEIDWPSDRQFRTDISKRLKKQLPELQKHGYAMDWEY